jgi:hypothetical protein
LVPPGTSLTSQELLFEMRDCHVLPLDS